MGKVYTAKELRKMIEADGWYFVDQDGSHAQFKHPTKKGKTTIPMHNFDINKKTANNILKQAGLKQEARK
jgi:predicted RNA binding protein YcfA (HicA-like mRNA interferase family)